MESAAYGLQRCHYNVLHENELRFRVQSMTPAQYESLTKPFVEKVGHKGSAIMHWLQLAVNSENPGQGGRGYDIIVVNVALFLLLELYSRRTGTIPYSGVVQRPGSSYFICAIRVIKITPLSLIF